MPHVYDVDVFDLPPDQYTSYVPVLATVKSPSTFVSEDELVLLVLCNTWTFLLVPPPPVYVPVTPNIVVPDLILPATKLASPLIV